MRKQEVSRTMKKQKLLFRLVIPMMLILFMLPPVSCVVFRQAAHEYAYSEASAELKELQQSILPAVSEVFDGTETLQTENTYEENSDNSITTRRGTFRKRIGSGTSGQNETERYRSTLRSRNNSSSDGSGYGNGNQRINNGQQNGTDTIRRPSPVGTNGSGTDTPRRHPQQYRDPNRSNSGSSDSESTSESTQNESSQQSETKSGTDTDENGDAQAEQSSYTGTEAPQFELLSNVKTISNTIITAGASDDGSSDSSEKYSDDTATPMQVREFLRKAGRIARSSSGRARLIILGPELKLIYPYDEEEQADISSLYSDISGYVAENADSINTESADDTVTVASGGQDYLVSISEIPMQSVEIKYVAAYCPTEQMDIWVNKASMIVLAISSALAALALAVLLLTVRSVTKPVRTLCIAADEIGSGSFETMQSTFSISELDELRASMNEMSDRLRRSDETQKNFFQNVSHELRNPLMSISGYAQGIEQGVFEHPEEVAHTILEESGRLTEIVSSLLTLSRLETAESEAQLTYIDINETVEDCLDRVNGQAVKNGIALIYDEPDEEFGAMGDEELCEQVICNFLTNAVRYAISSVEVSVHQQSDKVLIKVADDGKGISPDDIDHVFERCYKGAGGNFGIGLAIAQTAAHRMKGDVSAANRSDGGAVFTLTLNAAVSGAEHV